MSLSLKELKALSPDSLTKKLVQLKRPRLQSIAKQCNVKGNQPTIALLGALFESISGLDNETAGFGAIETPNNQPIYNPKYAPTPTNPSTTKRIQSTVDDTPLSCWKVTKSKQLLELEKELKTITPYKAARSVRRRKQLTEGKESRLLSSVKTVRKSVKKKQRGRPTPRRIQVDSTVTVDHPSVNCSSVVRERQNSNSNASNDGPSMSGKQQRQKSRFYQPNEEKSGTEARSKRAHDKFLQRMAAARQKRENRRYKV